MIFIIKIHLHLHLLNSDYKHLVRPSLVSRPNLAHILKAIRAGVGFGSGTETMFIQTLALNDNC